MVMRAYGKILRGTGSYLRLAFTPFLIAILPITFLIVQLDRYFGWMPLQPAEFSGGSAVEDPVALNEASLQLPPELRVLSGRTCFRKIRKWFGAGWRGVQDGTTSDCGRRANGFEQVVVAPGLAQVSRPVERNFWERGVSLGRAGPWQIIVLCNRSQ